MINRALATKLAKIEELVRAHESEGFGLLEHGTSGLSIADVQRRAMLKRLEEDPNWEPPKRWYSDEFGRKYGLPVE